MTIHNIPEGMAVGVIYAGLLSGAEHITVMGAFSLALGIVIQNFPEVAIISLPLRAEGISQKRAFMYGVTSGGYSYRLGRKPNCSASAILFKLCSRGNVLCCSRRTSSENVCWKVCQCRIFHVFSRVYFDDDFRCCTCLTPCVKMHAVITIRYTV